MSRFSLWRFLDCQREASRTNVLMLRIRRARQVSVPTLRSVESSPSRAPPLSQEVTVRPALHSSTCSPIRAVILSALTPFNQARAPSHLRLPLTPDHGERA